MFNYELGTPNRDFIIIVCGNGGLKTDSLHLATQFM